MSGGVTIAATIKIIMIAGLRALIRYFAFKTPTRDKRTDMTGISNMTPKIINTVVKNMTYS